MALPYSSSSTICSIEFCGATFIDKIEKTCPRYLSTQSHVFFVFSTDFDDSSELQTAVAGVEDVRQWECGLELGGDQHQPGQHLCKITLPLAQQQIHLSLSFFCCLLPKCYFLRKKRHLRTVLFWQQNFSFANSIFDNGSVGCKKVNSQSL